MRLDLSLYAILILPLLTLAALGAEQTAPEIKNIGVCELASLEPVMSKNKTSNPKRRGSFYKDKVLIIFGKRQLLIPAPYLNAYKTKFSPDRYYNSESFTLDALLPDLDHINPENKAEFMKLGWANKISIWVSKRELSILKKLKNLYQFNDITINLNRLNQPGLHSLPVTMLFKGKQVWSLSNRDNLGLAFFRCDLPGSVTSPGCEVDWDYFEGFDLDITFSTEYLPRKELILDRIRRLFEGFMIDARPFEKKIPKGK